MGDIIRRWKSVSGSIRKRNRKYMKRSKDLLDGSQWISEEFMVHQEFIICRRLMRKAFLKNL
jgi:hypothetical protein